MANRLAENLRANDKHGLFTRTQTAVSYGTGFTTLDHRNGFMIEARDMQDRLIKEYPSIGLVGGSFVTVVGKSGTAKTTAAIQWATRIVKPFESGTVIHYDLEQATNYTRVRNISGYTNGELAEKYILKQEKSYIEDIFNAIIAIAKEKEANRKEYIYKTGLLNEFGELIECFVPTVIILDSIPTLASKDDGEGKDVGMQGGTYSNRVAKALAQFYKRLTPVIKAYNIMVIAINHINQKIEINPMMKTQPQLVYMKMDESLPGGNAPIYYAHNLFKFVTAGKYIAEDDGFDGFKVRVELLKSRTNKAGQSTNLVYNQELGFDPIMTQYEFANDNSLIGGRNPYRYIDGYQDIKFDSRKFRKEFLTNEALRYATFNKTIPILERQLSRVDSMQTAAALTQLEVLERLELSQDGEIFEEEVAA